MALVDLNGSSVSKTVLELLGIAVGNVYTFVPNLKIKIGSYSFIDRSSTGLLGNSYLVPLCHVLYQLHILVIFYRVSLTVVHEFHVQLTDGNSSLHYLDISALIFIHKQRIVCRDVFAEVIYDSNTAKDISYFIADVGNACASVFIYFDLMSGNKTAVLSSFINNITVYMGMRSSVKFKCSRSGSDYQRSWLHSHFSLDDVDIIMICYVYSVFAQNTEFGIYDLLSRLYQRSVERSNRHVVTDKRSLWINDLKSVKGQLEADALIVVHDRVILNGNGYRTRKHGNT